MNGVTSSVTISQCATRNNWNQAAAIWRHTIGRIDAIAKIVLAVVGFPLILVVLAVRAIIVLPFKSMTCGLFGKAEHTRANLKWDCAFLLSFAVLMVISTVAFLAGSKKNQVTVFGMAKAFVRLERPDSSYGVSIAFKNIGEGFLRGLVPIDLSRFKSNEPLLVRENSSATFDYD